MAVSNFKKALKIKGNESDSLTYNIANNYWRWGKLDSALIYFDKTININPNLKQAYTNKAFVYILKEEYEKAKEQIQFALKFDPNSFNNLNNLGYVCLKLNDSKSALEYVNKSLDINPKNSWGYRNLGLIYKVKNDKKMACKNLDKALELNFIKYWGEADIQELLNYCR